MKLYLKGHSYKYAVEQILLALFPGERPEYPEGRPAGERYIVCSLSRGDKFTTAHTKIILEGEVFHGTSRAANTALAGKLAADRESQKILKLSFYRAAVKATGAEPASLVKVLLLLGLG